MPNTFSLDYTYDKSSKFIFTLVIVYYQRRIVYITELLIIYVKLCTNLYEINNLSVYNLSLKVKSKICVPIALQYVM